MPWIRIELGTSGRFAEAIGEKLFDLGAAAVTYLDDGDSPILEPDPWAVSDPEAWSAARVAGLFELDADLGAVRSAFPGRKLEIQFLADDDWVNAWRQFATVRKFGRLMIVPSAPDAAADGADPIADPAQEAGHPMEGGQTRMEVRPRRWGNRWHFLTRQRSGKLPRLKAPLVMRLDPGLAFGTGGHPTTRLCLEWLAGRDMRARSMLDYGCGSGVLAVAAKLMGAGRVVGVDHDPQALTATAANAARNGVRLVVEHGDAFAQRDDRGSGRAEDADAPFDIVMANIVSGTLVELAPRLSGCVAAEGSLVLCGVLEDQVEEVVRAYPGFKFRAPRGLEEWVLLHGERI